MYQVFYPFHGLCASLCTNGTTNGNGHENKIKTSKGRIVVAFTELLKMQVKFLEKYFNTYFKELLFKRSWTPNLPMQIIFESFLVSSDVLADILVTSLRNMGVRMLGKQKLVRFERIIWKNNNKEVRLTR